MIKAQSLKDGNAAENQPQLFCISCRHLKDDKTNPICSHPNNLMRNLVTGNNRVIMSVTELRNAHDKCAPAGKWFEPRPVPEKKPTFFQRLKTLIKK